MRAALALLVALAGCGEPSYLSREELLDPESCRDCHPRTFDEWKSSMHAYAADDPVFLAMNRRGQRETDGELGDFCVKCHAPMAVREGATTDGLNLDEVSQKLKGVTCYFCHNVADVEDDHNNPLVLADDDVMRAALSDPVDNGAHRMGYSPYLDRNTRESSKMCGACHDIVTPKGVHLERTFAEWQDSLFANDDPAQHLSCGRCHMTGDRRDVVADFPGVPLRRVHDHTFPGVDVAITEWPGKQLQLEGIRSDLQGVLSPTLCVGPAEGGAQIDYTLDNVFAGHMWPSGAAQDRRAWAEITAYRGGEIVYESGAVEDGEPVSEHDDPDLWQMRDYAFDENGEPVHMFWDVAEVESELLPPAVTSDPSDPAYNHSVTRSYTLVGEVPDRVTAAVHIRPIGLDVIDDLIESGDLDPIYREEIPTFTVEGSALEWTSEDDPCVTP